VSFVIVLFCFVAVLCVCVCVCVCVSGFEFWASTWHLPLESWPKSLFASGRL
jgi:hypothetical protein